jgi:hypothetical protein
VEDSNAVSAEDSHGVTAEEADEEDPVADLAIAGVGEPVEPQDKMTTKTAGETRPRSTAPRHPLEMPTIIAGDQEEGLDRPGP